tara:strand:+ start:242 stop:526 length:285 start_codon:yes stop_codon:yes gene_type:complete
MNEGSLVDPLIGIGARKGESVSIRSLSMGIDDAIFCNSSLLLKVIIPLKEIYAPRLSIFFEKLVDPVKQCIRIFGFLKEKSFKILKVSISAFLE